MYVVKAQTHKRLLNLGTLFVSNANGSFIADSMRPESIEIERTNEVRVLPQYGVCLYLHSSRAIMSQEKEVAKDTLREDILNGKDDGLGINTQLESKGTGGDGT